MLTTHQINALTMLVEEGVARVETKSIGYRTARKLHRLGFITTAIGFTRLTFDGFVAAAQHGAPVAAYISRGSAVAARMLEAEPGRAAHWQGVVSFYGNLAEAIA